MTLRHLSPPSRNCAGVGGLVCTSESLFWRWEFEIEAINPGLSYFHSSSSPPTPEQGNQSDTKQGASAPPSPECLFHPHQGLQGGTPEWSPGSPLSPFKCTHQPTCTPLIRSLNGVQIMQQRRLF